MEFSPIVPIKKIYSIEQLRLEGFGAVNNNTEIKGESFASILGGMMKTVTETANAAKTDAADLSLDKIADNLHNIEIDAMKADLALSTMISIRNKALDAYNEIMRITL